MTVRQNIYAYIYSEVDSIGRATIYYPDFAKMIGAENQTVKRAISREIKSGIYKREDQGKQIYRITR